MLKILSTLMIFLTILTGCAIKVDRDFDIRFENNYSRMIERIEMQSKRGAYARRNFLLPGRVSVIGLGPTYPANDIYEITWQYSKNEIYKKQFDLKNLLPEDFRGDIVFSVTENNDLIFYQWLSPFQYDYSISFINESEGTIYNLSVKSSKGVFHITKYLKKKLSSGNEARLWGLKEFPANAVYTINWSLGNSEQFTKKIDLTKIIEKDFEGDIQFRIIQNNEINFSYR